MVGKKYSNYIQIIIWWVDVVGEQTGSCEQFR